MKRDEGDLPRAKALIETLEKTLEPYLAEGASAGVPLVALAATLAALINADVDGPEDRVKLRDFVVAELDRFLAEP